MNSMKSRTRSRLTTRGSALFVDGIRIVLTRDELHLDRARLVAYLIGSTRATSMRFATLLADDARLDLVNKTRIAW
jgi:hypothetical protein